MALNEVLWVPVAALALWLAVVGSRLVLAVLRLMRMRFAAGEVQVVGREQMPADIAAVFEPMAERLAAFGFQYSETLKIPPGLRCPGLEPIWMDVYRHPEGASRAAVMLAEAPEPGMATAVTFSTHFPSGGLLTENRRMHLLLPMPPGWQVADALAASLEEHWAFHRRRLAAINEALLTDDDEIRRRHREFMADSYRHLQSIGILAPDGDDWRLTANGAYRFLRQVLAGNRQLAALPAMTQPEDLALSLIADRRAWVAQEAIEVGTGMTRRGKLLWFGLSALAGSAALGYLVSWDMVPVLLGVLLFHEFGHALAMRALGYRQLSVLVLPFIGAVAFGRKDDAGPWQKLVVLLAGPLPGLILAVVCLEIAIAGQGGPLLLKIGVMALVINLFNLLPLTPLDGGQIVDTFLFARRPRFRFAFFVVSVLALIGIALFLGSAALAAAAVLLALGIPGLWRRLRMLSGIDLVAESDIPTAIFRRLRAVDAGKLPAFAHRVQIVRMLQPLIHGRAPTLKESALGLSAYLASIALPIAILWHTGMPQGAYASLFATTAAQAAQPMPDWDRKLAAAPSPEARYAVHWEAGQWFEDREDDEQASQHYAAALSESAAFNAIPGDLRRLDAQLALARLAEPNLARQQHLDLLPQLRDLPPTERQRLAEVLEILNWQDATDPARRIAYLREAISVRSAAPLNANVHLLAMDRIALARQLDAQGETAEAGKELQLMLDATDEHFAWEIEPVVWFHLAHQQPGAAEKLLLGLPGALRKEPPLVSSLMWTLRAQGRLAEARQLLTAQLPDTSRQSGEWRNLQEAVDRMLVSEDVPGERGHWLSVAEGSQRKMGKQFKFFLTRLRGEAESGEWESRRGKARLEVVALLPGFAEALKSCEEGQ